LLWLLKLYVISATCNAYLDIRSTERCLCYRHLLMITLFVTVVDVASFRCVLAFNLMVPVLHGNNKWYLYNIKKNKHNLSFKNITFRVWDRVIREITDVSKERTVSIFRVEEQAKEGENIRFCLFPVRNFLGSFSGTENGVLPSILLWNSIVTRYVTHQKVHTPCSYRLWEPQFRQRGCSSHRIKRTDWYAWDNSRQFWRWYIYHSGSLSFKGLTSDCDYFFFSNGHNKVDASQSSFRNVMSSRIVDDWQSPETQ
jgi:hypothetical protein